MTWENLSPFLLPNSLTEIIRLFNVAFVLAGTTKVEEAQINQWLEYRVTTVDRCANIQDVHQVLKVLLSTTFFTQRSSWNLARVVLFLARGRNTGSHEFLHEWSWHPFGQHQDVWPSA